MVINHVALVCESEESSDRFYRELLGLRKERTKNIPGSLVRDIFGIERELKIMDYVRDQVKFEIFIDEVTAKQGGQLCHICLEMADVEHFMATCEGFGVETIRIPKGEGFLCFAKDFDGNLFEIKPLAMKA